MLLTLFSFLTYGSSPIASAQDAYQCEAQLTSLMDHAYRTPTLYRRGRCGDNVTNLVHEAERWTIDLSGAEVLVLQHESRMVPPVPAPFDYPLEPAPAPARGRPTQWKFHVILAFVRDGHARILDLDFAERPVPVDAYFAELFPARAVPRVFQTPDRAASIYLRRVPLAEYLDTHARLGGDVAALHYRERKDLISARTFLDAVRASGGH